MTDFIQLQHCNIYQETTDGAKTDWEVRENITGDVLFTLPRNLTDAMVWDLIHNIREYELKAFNAGIGFQKNKQNSLLTQENDILRAQLAESIEHSNLLAQRVEIFTRGDA